MSQKTFLLGVGCQKGGTTWLYDYLNSHPQCDLGFKKEYHVLDVVFTDYFGAFKSKWRAKLEKMEKKRRPKRIDKIEKFNKKINKYSQLLGFYDDLNAYADYFSELHDASVDTRLVGDITPSYCVLKKDDYLKVRELFEARGFTVKVVFLMRDPVERIYSAVRMKIRRKGERLELTNENSGEFFESCFTRPRYQLRTQFEEIVPQIEAAFDPADVYLGFFETLFTEESVRRLTGFLGIDYAVADFGRRMNASPKIRELDPDLVARARHFYDPTYAYCAGRFGADTIEQIWGYAGGGKHAQLVERLA